MERLVGELGDGREAIEVADGGVHVGRLDGVAAGHVDDVVALGQLDEVFEVTPVAGAAAVVVIGSVGCAGDLGEDHMIAAEDQIVGGIAGV